MTTAEGLLDTSAVLRLPQVTDPTVLPTQPVIAAITLAELSVGPLFTNDPGERARRQAQAQQAEADFEVLPFDAAAARTYARVAQAMRDSGRSVRPRALDALIAAVALSHGLPVHTANPDDFAGIPGLEVVDIRPGLASPT